MKRRRRPQRLPLTPITATIEKFSHEGRGIARIENKVTFIQGALAEELVTFQYTRKTRDFDEGKLLSVIESSPVRVEPHCEHYDRCGGCSLQHLDKDAQILEKQTLLMDSLTRIGKCQPEQVLAPLTANHLHYRNKARLSVRYIEKKQATLIGFREKNNPTYIADIKSCKILNARFDAQLLNLRALIDSLDNPRMIAQIELAAGDDDIALIFRNLEKLSEQDEEKIISFATLANFRIFLQPAGNDSVYLFYPKNGSDYLDYSLCNNTIQFKFHPTDFTQVNAELNKLMVEQALDLLALQPTDRVLDLFCGLGNFSLPLAKRCASVVGIEGSETMVSRAKMNAQANNLTNTEFFAANLEDEAALDCLNLQGFNKLLIDPPRAGALAIVKQINKMNPQRIVYVSCNPATLARDADILVNHHGYRLISAGVMDMFPHTAHVESIALFEKG